MRQALSQIEDSFATATEGFTPLDISCLAMEVNTTEKEEEEEGL